jgi:hypothetical protein
MAGNEKPTLANNTHEGVFSMKNRFKQAGQTQMVACRRIVLHARVISKTALACQQSLAGMTV